MYNTIRNLHYKFVIQPALCDFPEEAAPFEVLIANAGLDLIDAKDNLVELASLTAFREGLRLGLSLAWETALPPPPAPPPR